MHIRMSMRSNGLVRCAARKGFRTCRTVHLPAVRHLAVAAKSQAPVDRCTRSDLLPLLPSGPGGVHRATLRGTSARPCACRCRGLQSARPHCRSECRAIHACVPLRYARTQSDDRRRRPRDCLARRLAGAPITELSSGTRDAAGLFRPGHSNSRPAAAECQPASAICQSGAACCGAYTAHRFHRRS